MMVDFRSVLERFCAVVESNDGPGLAALFAEDGVYNDYLYGPFQGRDAVSSPPIFGFLLKGARTL